MEKKYRHTELNNEELKKLFTSGSMPISYNCLAGNEEGKALLKKYKLDLDIRYKDLTAEGVKLCHENGIKVNAWTVDDPNAAAALIEMGVDCITSNILE